MRRSATYTEQPAPAENPLDRFLFDAPRGYCQHFSGAMALLLRMGGVPARVAVGFTPGSRTPRRGEYVVRDLDAHSWVEAYFPRWGWVTFDPTPAAAPPREQSADIEQALGLQRAARRARAATARATRRRRRGRAAPAGLGRAGWPALALLVGDRARARAWAPRSRCAGARGRGPCPPELRELERALRICGRPAAAPA